MCSPEAVTAIGGQVTGIAGGIGEAKTTDAILERNEDQQRFASRDALRRGAERESDFRRNVAQLIGSQRARGAASGFDVNSGSLQLVQDQTRDTSELEATRLRTNAAREAFGHRQNVRFLRYQRRVNEANRDSQLTDQLLKLGFTAKKLFEEDDDSPDDGFGGNFGGSSSGVLNPDTSSFS